MHLLASQFKRPVVFFSNGFGDAVLNLPALRALSDIFHNRLSLVHSGGPHTFLFDGLALRERIVIPMWRANGTRQFDPNSVASKIGACDLFIALVPWISYQLKELVEQLSVMSIGYYSTYSMRLPLDFTKHTADLAFDMARVFSDADLDSLSYLPQFPPSAVKFVDGVKSSLPSQTRLLSVHTDTVPNKMWPIDRYNTCLREFLHLHRDCVVTLVGLGSQRLDLGPYDYRLLECRGLSMATSFALVAHSDFFFGIDSCMLHMADLARVPSVALFGPTKAAEFGFRFSPGIALQGQATTEEISPDRALSALLTLSVRSSYETRQRSDEMERHQDGR